MSLTARDIAEIARLLDESQFGSLDLQMGDFRVRIRRGGRSFSRMESSEAPAPAPAASRPSLSPPMGQEAGAPRVGEIDVPAPLLGNFYTAPRPGDPPFVQPGDAVSEDTTIGIIEVMKLMNPIRAGVAGTVVAILAVDGAAIEEGQPLIRVQLKG